MKDSSAHPTHIVTAEIDTAAIDVSVILPSYNSEAFIEASVRSILGQSGVSVEAIVVDDLGTDRTREILERIGAEAPNLHVIKRPPKMGQATARNDGMAVARGRYIAFLDSDDDFDGPNTLAKWVAHADALNLDISCAQFKALSTEGKSQPGRPVALASEPVVDVVHAPHLVNVTSCWQLLYRTNFLRQNGIVFCTHLRQREDRLFFIEALLTANRIGITPLSTVRHLNHPESSFHQIDLDQLQQYNIHLREMLAMHGRHGAAGRLGEAFAAANAHVYWRMLFDYWAPFILECLGPWTGATATGTPPDTPETAAVMELFDNLGQLADELGPFHDDTLLAIPPYKAALTAEARLDMGRLVLAAGRYNYLTRLLAGDRLLFGEVRALTGPDQPDWAEATVCRYMAFHRGVNFPHPQESDPAPPPLGHLVKRLILHVGPPKTGSSALQHTLELNRLRLLEAGVHYPLTGTRRGEGVRRDRTDGHARIIERILRNGANVERDLAFEVASLDRQVDTLILSAENILSHRFWDRNRKGKNVVQAVVDELGIEHVEVLALFRRQDVWFRSYYREVAANPFNRLVDTPEEFFENLWNRGLFDYERLIAEIDAPEQVKALHADSYEAVRASGGTVAWVLEHVGVADLDLLPLPPSLSNASLGDAMAENIRLAKLDRMTAKNRLSEVFEAVRDSPALAESRFRLITSALDDAFAKRLAPDIAAFDARFPESVCRAAPRGAPGDGAEPLPLLPEVRSLLNDLRRRTETVPSRKRAPLSRTARLRLEKEEQPGHAGALLAEAPMHKIAWLAVALPFVRLLRGPRRTRLYATRILTPARG